MKMLQEYWASTVIFIGIFSQYSQKKTLYVGNENKNSNLFNSAITHDI